MSSDVGTVNPNDLPPGTIVGGYRIERKLAEGGMGSVYIAAHTILPRRAALKALREELSETPLARESMIREACILESMLDPRVARVYDAGYLLASRPWIAMELLEGECLADLFVRKQRLTVPEVAQLVNAIVDALGAAHSRGVVHSDVKPENIMVMWSDEGAVVKMIDWGIAQVARTSATTTAATGEAFAIGTPHYMAPEQVRGEAYDQRADIYALGVLTYELLTGKTPFSGDTPADIALHHLRTPPPQLSQLRADVPPAIESLVAAMLAKDVLARPALETVRACFSLVSDAAFMAHDDPAFEGLVTATDHSEPRTMPFATRSGEYPVVSVEMEIDYTKKSDVRDELARPRWAHGIEPLGNRETLRLNRVVSSNGHASESVSGVIRGS